MTARPPRAEVKPPSNAELLETLLNVPGSTLGAYSRFHNYSVRNKAWFYMQGVDPQPVATYEGWTRVDRHVTKGRKAKYVLRPITIRKTDEDGELTGEVIRRFKAVKAIFALCDTEGEELKPLETPKWSLTRALGALAIEQVPFQDFNSNVAGYSYERKIAISDVSPHRLKTAMHECAHVILGHTTEVHHAEYEQHRGRFEFESEATAYLTLSAIDELDERSATVSRGYCQSWLQDERPTEKSIGNVLKAHDELLGAGLRDTLEQAA